jgi:Uma2 family endonuclease
MSDGESPIMRGSLKHKLDYSDHASAPEDGKRYEIADGDLIVTPCPSPLHQWVSKRLQRQLESWFETRSIARVLNAPIAVILSDHDVLEPDLVVVADEGQFSKRGVEGPPLIVVEILSPAGHERDRGVKWRRYATFGVPHYWIVDPDARRLECHRLEGRGYRLALQGEADAVVGHPDWAGLTLDLGALWW